MKQLPAMPDSERWAMMSFNGQMANIGSEVGRTAKWIAKGQFELAEGAFIRALDLYDLTILHGRKNQKGRFPMLRELCLNRCEFAAAYLNKDSESLTGIEKYFSHFAIAYAREHSNA